MFENGTKRGQRQRIEAQEVVDLMLDVGTSTGSMRIALDVKDEWQRRSPYPNDDPGGREMNNLCLLAAVFEAGRIQGIREERAKGKAAV